MQFTLIAFARNHKMQTQQIFITRQHLKINDDEDEHDVVFLAQN